MSSSSGSYHKGSLTLKEETLRFSVQSVIREGVRNLCSPVGSRIWVRMEVTVSECTLPCRECGVVGGLALRDTDHACLVKGVQCDSFGTRPKKMRISQRLFIRF